MLTWAVIGSVVLLVLLAVFVAVVQRAEARRNAQQHTRRAGTAPGAQPQPSADWFIWSRKLAVTAIKEGAAVIVALVTLVVIYNVLWAAVPDFMSGYEAGRESTKWLVLIVVAAIALAAGMVNGNLRWVFVLPLLVLLTMVVVLPLTSGNGWWDGSSHEDVVAKGPKCDGIQITVALHPGPQPVRPGCIMAWGIDTGTEVTLLGPNGEKDTVLQNEARKSSFVVAQWEAPEGTLVDVAYCPRKTHWNFDHCEPDASTPNSSS